MAMNGIWSPDFASLRKSLGLGAAPNTGGFALPSATPKIGRDFLSGDEGFRPLLQLYSGQLGGNAASILPRQASTINDLYKAAVALQPDLQPDAFLRDFDYAGFLNNLSPFERGERPGAYQRGFKFLTS